MTDVVFKGKDVELLCSLDIAKLNRVQAQAVEILRVGAAEELKAAHKVDYRVMHSEVVCLRFAQGQKGNMPEALRLYKNSFEWRRKNNMAKVREEIESKYAEFDSIPDTELLRKYLARTPMHFQSKDGGPVAIELTGLMKHKDMMNDVPRERFMRWIHYMLEWKSAWMENASRKHKRIVSETRINDLKGMDSSIMWRPGINLFKEVATVAQENYPESMRRVLIVNAPWVFTLLWRAIRVFLHPATIAKVNILGADYKSVLLEHVEASNLPQRFGGSCRCPRGCIVRPEGALWDESGTHRQIKVPARKVLQEEIEVISAGTIDWTMKVVDHDVKFEVVFTAGAAPEPEAPEEDEGGSDDEEFIKDFEKVVAVGGGGGGKGAAASTAAEPPKPPTAVSGGGGGGSGATEEDPKAVKPPTVPPPALPTAKPVKAKPAKPVEKPPEPVAPGTKITGARMEQVRETSGTLKVGQPGVLTLKWDNAYSWTRGKNVQYVVDVVPFHVPEPVVLEPVKPVTKAPTATPVASGDNAKNIPPADAATPPPADKDVKDD